MAEDQWIRGPGEFERLFGLKVILDCISLNSFYYQNSI